MTARRDYSDPAYKAWRKKVYARDRYRCRFPGCNTNSRKLEAHHIRRWADCPGLRFSAGNGISLCAQHHALVTGREDEFAPVFEKIVGGPSQNILLSLLMKRHADNGEKHDDHHAE